MTATTLTAIDEIPARFEGGERLYEIVDGQYVEKHRMGAKAENVSLRITKAMLKTVDGVIGTVGHECLIRLSPDSETCRRPDVCFVSFDEWPKDREFDDSSAWEVRPDLCIEVVSPTDRSQKLMTKVDEYFQAGVKAVWLVYVDNGYVQVFESMDSTRIYRRNAVLPGGAALPGFSLNLADVLPEPVAIDLPSDE